MTVENSPRQGGSEKDKTHPLFPVNTENKHTYCIFSKTPKNNGAHLDVAQGLEGQGAEERHFTKGCHCHALKIPPKGSGSTPLLLSSLLSLRVPTHGCSQHTDAANTLL